MSKPDTASIIKAAVLLFLFTLALYSNSLGGEFVYDDEYFVVKNIAIRSLVNIPSFFTSPCTAFSELGQDVYRPLTMLSYALDYHLWRLNTFGYHLVNVIFHSFNAILVFLFLYAAFGDIFLGFLAAMLFTSHPVQTEVVAWISGRSSILCLFFYLAALLSYVIAFKKDGAIRRGACLGLSLAAYAASLLSKEMAVSLPLILMAYDAHFQDDEPFLKRLYSRYAPYIILTILFIMARSAVLQRVSQCGWWGASPYHTFVTMLQVLPQYIRLMLLPVNLCAFYILNVYTSVADMRVLASLAMLALVLILTVLAFRRVRGASFAMWWFLIALLPVSNIVPLRTLMAERFLYLPSIGFCLLAAVLIERMALAGFKKRNEYARILAAALAVLLIVSYSLRTIVRNRDWKDTFTITKSILRTSPMNPWALSALGEAYSSLGRYEEAVKPLAKAVALTEGYFSPRNILGSVYIEMERYDDAIRVLEDALRIKPDNLEALISLGIAYAGVKRYDDALKQFERAAAIDRTFVKAYMNIGTTYERMGRYEEAIEAYGKVERNTRSQEDIAMAYVRMGDAYIKKGLVDKAREYYARAAGLCSRGMSELKKTAIKRLNARWDVK